MEHLVVDIETKRNPESVEGGWISTDKLGIGCAVVYSYKHDSYDIYQERHLADLQERLLHADRLTGFNVYKFDWPVIWKMTLKDWLKSDIAKNKIIPKTNDLLRKIWIALGLDPLSYSREHRGWGLNSVVSGTLNYSKIAEAETAPKMLADGNWDWVSTYCMDDVRLTRDLNDFIDRYGYVVNNKDVVLRFD